MELVKHYFEYVQNPTQALQNLIKTPSFKQSCWGYFAAALSWVLFFNIGDGLSVPAFLLKVFILLAAELTLGCLVAALSGLLLNFRGKHISSAQLFVLIGYAGFIKTLLIACALISAMWPHAELWLLAPLVMLAVFVLQVVFLARALQRVADIPATLGVLSLLFGAIPVGALFMLLGIFFAWFILLL